MPCERHGANTGYSPDQQKRDSDPVIARGFAEMSYSYRASGGKLDSIAVTAATAAGVTGGSACHFAGYSMINGAQLIRLTVPGSNFSIFPCPHGNGKKSKLRQQTGKNHFLDTDTCTRRVFHFRTDNR